MNESSALVTGGAGFIGSHLVDSLMDDGWEVTVVDNFDPYYDPAVKRENVAPHLNHPRYHLAEVDIRDADALRSVFLGASFDVIVHLAARAGVRASIDDPIACQQVNVTGTQHLLELAQEHNVPQFVFGSSSSVYGTNPDVPWSEEDHDLRPISPYASTKLSAEFLGHTYQHLYDLRFVALRFFTVYGDGTTRRDYTYVADIVRSIKAAMHYEEQKYAVMNVGSGEPIELNDMIDTLEEVLGRRLERNHLPEQPGDVPQTWADIQEARRRLSYEPEVNLEEGVRRFISSLNLPSL